MVFLPKAGVDIQGAKVIALGGQEWFVPVLAVRQNRVVIPLLIKLLPLIERGDPARADPELGKEWMLPENIDLATAAVHAALTRAYSITWDEFLDLPIQHTEWITALGPIITQTQFFAPAADAKDPPTGEADAATST